MIKSARFYRFGSAVFLFVIVFSFLNLAPAAQAALVTCGTSQNPQACTICDLVALVKRIIDFVLFQLSPAVAVLLYLWAGFMILLGGTLPKISSGKTVFWNTTLGLVIMFSAWMITNTILKSLATNDVSDKWYQIQCKEPIARIVQPPSVLTTVGDCLGLACQGDTANICGSVDPGDGCDLASVNALSQDISLGAGSINICSGVDTVRLLKAIVANESDGRVDIGSSDGLSAGPFQLTEETARRFKSACGVTENINFDWLRREDTIAKQSCLAAEFIKTLVGPCGCDLRQLAAGYNGGGKGEGACEISADCGPAAAAAGGQCSICQGQNRPTRKWECLWDDNQHRDCNNTRVRGSFAPTRLYAPRVEYCYARFN